MNKCPEVLRVFFALSLVTSLLVPFTSRITAKSATVSEKTHELFSASTDHQDRMRVTKAYGQIPLSFEPNQGQSRNQAKFISRGAGYNLFLMPTEALLSLSKAEKESAPSPQPKAMMKSPLQDQTLLRMKLIGANPNARSTGENQLEGKSNYFIGNDPKKWRTNIPRFGSVRYSRIYPGIDLLYYGTTARQLEYDLIVSPGADPSLIQLQFEGAEHTSINEAGELVLKMSDGAQVVQRAPVVYQETHGVRATLDGKYVLHGGNVGLQVANYDRSKQLVIDPQIVYSTYYAGSGLDAANGIVLDRTGNAYVTGDTTSVDLPMSSLIQPLSNSRDAFVMKLNAAGSDIVYATYLGGNLADNAASIALTSDRRAVITGRSNLAGLGTTPNNFPTTTNAFQRNPGPREEGFVSVISADGNSLLYSTYLGGTRDESGAAVAVDNSNMIYVGGRTSSQDFPVRNAFQSTLRGQFDSFVVKLNPNVSGNASLLYSTYLGGGGLPGTGDFDFPAGIAADANGNAFVCGSTNSPDFPTKGIGTTTPPFQASIGGGDDAYVTELNTTASGAASLVHSTFFGGTGDEFARDIALDPNTAGVFYVVGETSSSSATFPLRNAFDSTSSSFEGFIAKFNASFTGLFYSSFLGGTGSDSIDGIAVDEGGNAYVTGRTTGGASFPLVNASPLNTAGQVFATKISPTPLTSSVPRLLYSTVFGPTNTFLGGIALDSKGNVYITGHDQSFDLQTTPGAFQTNPVGGSADAFVIKLGSSFPDTVGTFNRSAGVFLLRNSNTTGTADIVIDLKPFIGNLPGDIPITGDWNGDGKDEVGVFRNGVFLLAFPIVTPAPNGQPVTTFAIVGASIPGTQAGDIPVVGDWNGDGTDTIGLYRAGNWLLCNTLNGTVDLNVAFGLAGDQPIVGDWNGNGIDKVGVGRPSGGTLITWFLRNSDADVPIFNFGQADDFKAVAGDWQGTGFDTVGSWRNALAQFFLFDGVSASLPVAVVGQSGDVPLAGEWDGKPPPANLSPNGGVNSPSDGTSVAGQTQIFTTSCSDPNGWHDIHTIDFKVEKGIGKEKDDGPPLALWVQFDEDRNVIRFFDPDLDTWSEATPGANLTFSSRFADLHLAGTVVQGSGPTGTSVQVTWEVVFKEAAIKKDYRQFLQITDDSGLSTEFDRVGSWNVAK